MVMRYQPQGLVRLAASPLRRGLVAYMPLSSTAFRDAQDGSAWAATGPVALGIGPRGIGLRPKGATAQYVSRAIPAGLSTSTTQPVSLRYRLLLNAAPSVTAIMSWGNTPQDGSPRQYARVTGGTLNVFIAGSYRPSGSIAVGREYVITYVFDGSAHYVYIDGVQTGVTGGAQTNNASSFFLGIGYDGANAGTDFNISDFALWNRALSPAEVFSDAQAPWQMFADPYEDDEIVVSAVTPPTGTIPSILSGASLSAQGFAINAGAFSSSLTGASLSSSGAVAVQPSGVFASTLGGMAMASSGNVLNNGQITASLTGASMASSGTVAANASGAFASQLMGVMATFSDGQNAGTGTGIRPYRWRILRRGFQSQ